MSKISKKVQLKSLWAFFKSTLKFGLSKASPEEREFRKHKCITCPHIRLRSKSKYQASKYYSKAFAPIINVINMFARKSKGRFGCGICGCNINWRITPAASFCPDTPRRWDVEKRESLFIKLATLLSRMTKSNKRDS